MEDEVQNLETVAGRLYDKRVYIEVTTRNGVKETGRLIRIDEADLVMSPHYYYSSRGDSVVKVEVEEVIPKDEIIILKVF